MIRQLITLPFRGTRRAAGLLYHGAARALSLAGALSGRAGHEPDRAGHEPDRAGHEPDRAGHEPDRAGHAREPVEGRSPRPPAGRSARARSQNGVAPAPAAPPAAGDAAAPTIAPPAADRAAAAPPIAPPSGITGAPEVQPEFEPPHVSAEPELVAERADPGAADGAGAQLTIEEPWPGYAKLTAAEIIARLPAASDAELAVTELYEAAHKQRRTVLSALRRQLGGARDGSDDPGGD
jgi:hypothetical protein